jgi:hypothetical protein
MFPAGLYSLTPRDQVGVPVELVTRAIQVTTDSTFFLTSVVYTVPQTRIFKLTNAGVSIQPDGASLIRSAQVYGDLPNTQFVSTLAMKAFLWGALALPQVVLSWEGEYLFPPTTTLQFSATMTSAAPANSTYEFSLQGFSFPLGTINPTA